VRSKKNTSLIKKRIFLGEGGDSRTFKEGRGLRNSRGSAGVKATTFLILRRSFAKRKMGELFGVGGKIGRHKSRKNSLREEARVEDLRGAGGTASKRPAVVIRKNRTETPGKKT